MFFLKAFRNCFIKPSLICSEGKMIFSRSAKKFHVFSLRPLFHSPVVRLVSAIPETQEARTFVVVTLLTKEKVYHFKCTQITHWCLWYFIVSKTKTIVLYCFFSVSLSCQFVLNHTCFHWVEQTSLWALNKYVAVIWKHSIRSNFFLTTL